MSSKVATLHELHTVYGVKAAYDMLELITVDAVNEFRAHDHAMKMAKMKA